MKTPLTYGAHRILHDLFSKGAMFKGALSREKLPELEERGFVATNANNLVYLTPPPASNMQLNPLLVSIPKFRKIFAAIPSSRKRFHQY